jgi:hypothetical protein
MREIIQSRAYSNQFFQLACSHQVKPDLGFAIREWFLGTRTYCLGLAHYAGMLSREVINRPWEEQARLEDAFVVPLHLAAEEFSMGLRGGAGAHYRLFARIGEPLGIDLDSLRSISAGSLPETRALVDSIDEMFHDVYRGAGCLRVFELVGLKICEAFGNICTRGIESNWFDFNEYHLEYVDIHLRAEPEHNDLAVRFIEALCDTPEKEATVTDAVRELCATIGDFWDAVAERTFHSFTDEKAAMCPTGSVPASSC